MNLRSSTAATPTPSLRAVDHLTGARVGRARQVGVPALLLAVMLAALAAGVAFGSVRLSPAAVADVILHHLGLRAGAQAAATDTIVWQVRVPRVLLGALVGAGLAMVGATLQATVRNPIADPFLLGISSGASVGAVLVVTSGLFGSLGVYSLSSAAFLGATAAAGAVLVVSRGRRGMSSLRVVLAGTAMTYACSAITSFLIFRSRRSNAAQTLLFWLLGSLSGASWAKLIPSSVVVVGGGVLLWAYGRHLNALLAGDATAASLGIDVARFRRTLIVVTALMTASLVAVSGAIGFVGLLLPHVGRFLVGADHRRLLPVCPRVAWVSGWTGPASLSSKAWTPAA